MLAAEPISAALKAYPSVPSVRHAQPSSTGTEEQQLRRVRELEGRVEQLRAKLDAAPCADVHGAISSL